jgi:hypothetical protein
MQVETSETPYEIRCHQCQVSFPLGTRQCVHCGERLGRGRGRFVPTPNPEEPWDLDSLEEEEHAAEATPSRRRFLSPFTLIWLVAAVGLSIQRACTGE